MRIGLADPKNRMLQGGLGATDLALRPPVHLFKRFGRSTEHRSSPGGKLGYGAFVMSIDGTWHRPVRGQRSFGNGSRAQHRVADPKPVVEGILPIVVVDRVDIPMLRNSRWTLISSAPRTEYKEQPDEM